MHMITANNVANKKTGVILLVLSIAAGFYWILGNSFNVYQYAIPGAIFEILWFPMLLLLFILPALAIFLAVKQKFKKSLYYFFTVAISILIMLILFFMK